MTINTVKRAFKLFFCNFTNFKQLFWYRFSGVLPEKFYYRVLFRLRLGYKLDLNNPQTFNEKLSWLKFYNRNPEYTRMVDKYAVKDYVRHKIGDKYIVPCFGVWNTFEDINIDNLPDKFVLKLTHNSCFNIVCKDKTRIDWTIASNKFKDGLKRKLYKKNLEWPYKDVPPRIIADKYLDDNTGKELLDYKFWCFNGNPKVMYFSIKGDGVYENFYDMEFNPVDINHSWPRRKPEFEKPDCYEEMISICRTLSKDIPFVRVDFFVVNNHPYFAELTFFDWAGLRPFDSYETDLKIGSWLTLPDKKIL